MATIKYRLQSIPQWQFVDPNTGAPLSGGTMEFYEAKNHAAAKTVYKDSEGKNPWANPITLNVGGIPIDQSNNTHPVYFADDEAYYVELKNKNGLVVDAWDDYPFKTTSAPSTGIDDDTNYVINGQFQYFPKASITNLDKDIKYLAGGGWSFYKSNTTANDRIDFKRFTPGQSQVPQTPTYYFVYECSTAGSNETRKDVLYQIPSAISLEGLQVTLSFYASSVQSSVVDLLLRQEFGTSSDASITPSTPVETTIGQVTGGAWSETKITFTIPNTAGKTFGNNGDDAIYLIFRMPLNATASFEMTNVDLRQGDGAKDFTYAGNNITKALTNGLRLPNSNTDNVFSSIVQSDKNQFIYDNTAGLIEKWLNDRVRPGRLKCDGASYFAQDKKLLFAEIGTTYGFGEDAFFCDVSKESTETLFATCNKSGVPFGGGTVFTGNPKIGTFKSVSTGTGNGPFQVYYSPLDSNKLIFKVPAPGKPSKDPTAKGFDVSKISTDASFTNQIVYMELKDASAISAGEHVSIWIGNKEYTMWIKKDGKGTAPSSSGTLIEVDIKGTDKAHDVALSFITAASSFASGEVKFNDVSGITGGDNFGITSPTTKYLVYYVKDGVGQAPTVTDEKLIKVEITGSDTKAQLCTKTIKAINEVQFKVPLLGGYFDRAFNGTSGIDPDAANRIAPDQMIGAKGSTVGSLQPQQTDPYNTMSRDNTSTERSVDIPVTPGVRSNPVETGNGPLGAIGIDFTFLGKDTRPTNVALFWTIRYS